MKNINRKINVELQITEDFIISRVPAKSKMFLKIISKTLNIPLHSHYWLPLSNYSNRKYCQVFYSPFCYGEKILHVSIDSWKKFKDIEKIYIDSNNLVIMNYKQFLKIYNIDSKKLLECYEK